MDPDCDLWSKTDSDDDEMTLAIIPPLEKACVDSDRDSDASDDLNEVLTHHFPRRLLNSICSTKILSYNSKLSHQSEQESQHKAPPTKKLKKKKKIIRRWKKNFPLNIPNVVLSNSVPAISEQTKENLKNPLDTFNAMISCDIITHITHQTNLYASQKEKI